MELTDLEDLSKVCVSVGEHGVDALDGILGLARRASLSFSLQHRQQDTRGSRRDGHREVKEDGDSLQGLQQ